MPRTRKRLQFCMTRLLLHFLPQRGGGGERPDDEARQKISVVQERLVKEYGYDEHSAQEALNYVTTLLSQE